jgi:prephenate dehydrogenase
MRTTTIGRVSVLGSGLIGTSIALALRHAGVHVTLSDHDADVEAEAVRMGGGVALRPTDPPADVVVIATPPSTVVGVLRDAQRRALGAVYTDVASTKARIVADAERAGCDLGSYVPGHPMAGRELSGPRAARPDLFNGRPWVVCPHPATGSAAMHRVTELIEMCGAERRVLAPDVHDRMVATVSHAPHLIAAALAARFAAADDTMLALVGKGLWDTTRIATGAAGLWSDILEHNADSVAAVLEAVVHDLADVVSALRGSARVGHDALADLLIRGNRGRQQITESLAGVA